MPANAAREPRCRKDIDAVGDERKHDEHGSQKKSLRERRVAWLDELRQEGCKKQCGFRIQQSDEKGRAEKLYG